MRPFGGIMKEKIGEWVILIIFSWGGGGEVAPMCIVHFSGL